MSQQEHTPSQTKSNGLLATGGEMGERTRSFDWSKTHLGPIERWPQELKTIVRVMLDSRYAMWLGWGPEFTFFYNDAYARMTLGPKHPWALGRSAREVWSEIWADIGPRAESVYQTGQATWDEGLLLFLERQGFREETYHTFSYSPVPDDQGGVGGLLCVVTEDTERTIGERRLRTIRELATRTTEAAKSIEAACQTAAQILAGNLQDVPFALLYLLDEACTRARLVAATGVEPGSPICPYVVELAGEKSLWQFRLVASSGQATLVRDLPAEFGTLPGGAWPEPSQQALVLPMMKPGQPQLAGIIVAGISPRRPFDDAYRGFFDLLAGQVASAVSSARAYEEEKRRAEALSELDRAKTAFFSNVSHEFRTPLTLMLGPVEDLLVRSHTDLSPAAAGQLAVVNRNGLRLLRLVNTLLDFSRIEAGRVRATYQQTDLGSFTADLASNFRSACDRAGLRLVVDCPPTKEAVFLDRSMWEKIVLNLLSNAFKFTFDGEISVTTRSFEERSELILRDTGVGIPADDLPRLFERFHRVENSRGRTHEGSGIGLALVQELVKLHGGSIRAQSKVNEGTVFVITLPTGKFHLPPDQVSDERAIAATRSLAGPYVDEALRWLPDGQSGVVIAPPELPFAHNDLPAQWLDSSFGEGDDRPRVLVADDNADMRNYVSGLLSHIYKVLAVPDGEAALSLALEQPPDLILTDVMMPKLDGFGLIKALRANPATSGLPVIMLSARAGEESRVEGLESGADDYLVKPFSAKELLARVGAHLQINRLRRESEQAIRQSEERFRVLFEMMTEGFAIDEIIFDKSGRGCDLRYLEVNPAFERHTGLKRSEILGRTTLELFPDAEPFWFECFGKVASTGIPAHFQAKFGPLDRWFEVSAYRTEPGRVATVFFDITERKRADEAVEDANRRKDEFLATLAHELRNPLAPLRNGLQIMQLAGGDRAAVEQARAMMERQLGQMVHLVDDLLDLSRISLGKVVLRTERVELGKVIHQAVETSRPHIDESGHELRVELAPQFIYVDADVTRLAQVISNLLNNAAKYTERGGRITLSALRQRNVAVVTVHDTGVGIPPHMLPRVFDMFTQVDRTIERSRGGLGIGLSIVKSLIELHGGSVEAKSGGHGKGSEFIIRLPVVLSLADEDRNETDQATVAAKLRRRILVVDDNRDAAVSLAIMLKLFGNETQTAYDGLEALELAANFRPDLVMLDIGMPKLNGYDTAIRIREQPWGKNMILVALTGWGQEEDKRRAFAAGFNFHLVKPIDPATLEKLLAGVQTSAG